MRLRVLVRTDRYAVVAKPARLPCHRSAMTNERRTLVSLARARFGERVHLVHRLDRAVSGCLMIAFDPETTRVLQEALHAEDAVKTYVAFVRGAFRREGVVEVDTDVRDDLGQPKPARSLVRCLGRSDEPRCSLLEVRPLTGRFHQVRRHVRDLNHPILGDGDHGDSRVNRAWRDEHDLQRLGLHCLALDVPLPDGSRLSTWCPPPEDLVRIWRTLPWWADAVAAEPRLGFPPLPLDAGP
jgi:tRNA pseudouridine65 synthase